MLRGSVVIAMVAALAGCERASAPPPAAAPAPVADASLRWATDEAAAFAEARGAGTGVMVFFEAAWAMPTKELAAYFERPDVVAALAGWVPLRVDVTEASDATDELAARYRAEVLPAVIFVRADGTELGRITRTGTPASFIAAIPRR